MGSQHAIEVERDDGTFEFKEFSDMMWEHQKSNAPKNRIDHRITKVAHDIMESKTHSNPESRTKDTMTRHCSDPNVSPGPAPVIPSLRAPLWGAARVVVGVQFEGGR